MAATKNSVWDGNINTCTLAELRTAYQAVFQDTIAHAHSGKPALWHGILAVVSPLRLDFEINKQRGLALNGEKS